MRLIDADKLKKDDEVTMWLSNDAIRTGKQLKMFSELFINKIDNTPTVQAVPIDVFDKIKAEMQDYSNSFMIAERSDLASAVSYCIEIINKYN